MAQIKLLPEKLLNMELSQVLELGDPNRGQTVECGASGRPTPTRFVWSFVPLLELAGLFAKRTAPEAERETGEEPSVRLPLNKQAELELELESKSSTLNLLNAPTQSSLFAQPDTKPPRKDQASSAKRAPEAQAGLLLCRALNEIGWQEEACASLLLPPGE